jgi:serine/threonine protein kinase/tetratricopeptide (TPR) repeat protein
MICSACGAENPEDTKFCGECGASIDAPSACLACGFANVPGTKFCRQCGRALDAASEARINPESAIRTPTSPESFCGGRYRVVRFLGEGGKKRVFLAHDTKLDRDVAFALIKADGLDAEGETRIRREAQAMGKLGDHPNIVPVYDIGDENGQPYLVTQLMGGGDVEGLIEKAPGHRLALDAALRIGDQVCQALQYAHAKGIVHRDLKPGNVWLTIDGTAKLGDFGLAVALDRSRLTQTGMMVGTVSYMPPEQAIGGEVTERSDLYSLGCMLYEMVCGRPPFVGDESVAIIGQHLNTPPVAPTWHRPDCPPGLEALILRLLEKDPGDRPQSAHEAQQALAHVELTAPIPSEAEAHGTRPPDNPLYRRTFVGRENELRQLRVGFDSAASGLGALVMVVGEPGIGKTALIEQLATYATLRGGKSLVGHCYEEGSLSLPYLPFVEALRSYILTREPDRLRDELGSGAAEVARIISEVRDRVQVELPQSGEPEDDRWRLFQAVTGFLRNAAAVQPILLVLEDLHWADHGTLDYLVHLARNLGGARLLIVGSYRDVEVDRAHPLSATVGELRRTGELLRVPLRGLTVDEVHRMINALQGQEARWSLAEAVHRQTEGSPLFIQEVLRYLAEEGLITHEGGRWHRAGDDAPETHIPEGLRDVIGRRLSRLGTECNRLLGIAAVIGREFELQTLQSVAGLDEEMLLTSLEEALRASVLEEQSRVGVVRYRFTHAFFRQTLYEEIIAPRRIRLHQQVGRALEAIHARRLDEHAAELAEHFSHSSEPSDLAKAVEYGDRAAQRATAVFAYGEAARHLERCLQVQEVLDPDDKARRCDLLLALGDVLTPGGELLRAAREVASEAFALAEALGSPKHAIRASLIALHALNSYGRLRIAATPEYQDWAGRADAYAAAGSVERVQADGALSAVYTAAGRRAEGAAACRRALELARSLGERDAFFVSTARMLILFLHGVDAFEERRRLAEEVIQWPREGVTAGHAGTALWIAGHVLLAGGDRAKAEDCWRQMVDIADRTHDATVSLSPLEMDIVVSILDGDFEHALVALRQLVARAEELGLGGAAQPDLYAARLCAYLAQEEVANTVLGRAERAGMRVPHKALCLAHLGRQGEARDALHEIRQSASAEEGGIDRLTISLETIVLLGDKELTAEILPRLVGAAHLLIETYSDHTCVARHLGAAAALLGDHERARSFTAQAIELATRVRHRPEIALSRLQLAELLLEGSAAEQRSAAEHLDFAIAELREMKMQPALERALGHKGLLKA